MSQYRRLTLVEREELSRLFVAGHTVRAAARALGRAPSTVSRELARHYRTRVTYRAVRAHTRASRWAHIPRKPRKLAIQPALRQAVFFLLAQRWSPE
jgi:transposase, IS30 family